jgi:hypothetical protein
MQEGERDISKEARLNVKKISKKFPFSQKVICYKEFKNRSIWVNNIRY